MTNHYIDLRNSDVILIQGSNMAEHHPVAMKWALKAQERGAKIIHVDPRYTRTSSKADVYCRLRSGTDIAFLGGMIKYIIENNKYFKEYVENYTNALFKVPDTYSFNDGLFAGYNPATRKYDTSLWKIHRDSNNITEKAASLDDPNSVFQKLKEHYSRYDLDTVSAITGTSKEDLLTVYELYSSTGVRDKSGTMCYALGQTQHTTGVQNIRCFGIIQLLLGNIGICGGGVNALRGEPNVQGSTDMALLYHYLPGYLKAPRAGQQTLDEYVHKGYTVSGESKSINWWKNYKKYIVSQLKTWFGSSATSDNDFAFSWVPKVDDSQDASTMTMFDEMYKGNVKGYMTVGTDPAVSNPNSNKVRAALKNLDWLMHVNIFDNETASFWKGPGNDPADIKTEVFLLPAAASVEKEGSQANSGRWQQWKYQAATPPGDALYTGEIMYRLMLKLQELYESEGGTFPEPIQNLRMKEAYDDNGSWSPLKAAKELNGFFLEGTTIGTITYKAGELVPGFGNLDDSGKTSCGLWLYSGSFTKDGTNLMTRRGKEDPTGLGLYPNWAFCWPYNRRIIYNRASVDLAGNPWNPARPLLQWNGSAWVGDVVDGGGAPASDPAGKLPFIMKTDGVGALYGPDGPADGPFPEHYEPLESPMEQNVMSAQQNSPIIKIFSSDMDKVASASADYPIVATSYSCTEHWCSGAYTRWQPRLTELQPEVYVEMSEELALSKGIENGEKIVIESIRGSLECVAMVTKRFKPLNLKDSGGNDKVVHQVGLTFNYGWLFPKNCGDTANILTPTVGDGNAQTPEYKAFMVNVRKL